MDEDPLTGTLRAGDASFPPRDVHASPSASQGSTPEESPPAPQLAIRARMNAIVLDLVLLSVVATVLLGLLGESSRSVEGILFAVALSFVYFFICEVRTGHTIGKRVFHVRVTTLSGAPPTVRQVAIRNAARILDALPLLYASGLISMTFRSRRQRIGDVLAGTTVVTAPGGTPLRTPRWLLPAATILATALSLAVILPALDRRHKPARAGVNSVVPNVPQVVGFGGDNTQTPRSGRWRATVMTETSVGYSNQSAHRKRFQIVGSCRTGGACSLMITVEPPHERPISAALVPGRWGWRAEFPPRWFVCGATANGQTIYWPQHTTLVFHFTDGGHEGEADEEDLSYAAGCGYGNAMRAWTARATA